MLLGGSLRKSSEIVRYRNTIQGVDKDYVLLNSKDNQ